MANNTNSALKKGFQKLMKGNISTIIALIILCLITAAKSTGP